MLDTTNQFGFRNHSVIRNTTEDDPSNFYPRTHRAGGVAKTSFQCAMPHTARTEHTSVMRRRRRKFSRLIGDRSNAAPAATATIGRLSSLGSISREDPIKFKYLLSERALCLPRSAQEASRNQRKRGKENKSIPLSSINGLNW